MDEPFLEQTRRHQQKSLIDTLTACLPCFPKGRKAGEPAQSSIEDSDVPSGDDARLRQSLRSTELELQQAEQRYAAANIAREKVQKELERERSLRTQAEDALAILRRSSSESKQAPPAAANNNSAALVEKDKEITSLKQQVDRYSKKLATLEKYKDSLEAQIQQSTSATSAGSDQEQALRKQLSEKSDEISRLSTTITQLQSDLKKEKDQSTSASEEKRKAESSRVELEAKVKELEAEIAFRDSIEKQIGDTAAPATSSAPPARASRGRALRGRSVRPVSTTPAPAEESEEPQESADSPGGDPPPVPQRGSLADRMKAFQQ